ncbi:unnamed protein product [Pseudo-nitzschia multistriata]|uniref:PDZ domain-containing protein n=1 Tax=Pseudo-nitzschia multistriata TaxID=183589 RepID=A0A448Z5I7_9STRA|nr:unnamed protein product [Pseudo-nitzschia multistriata]
MFEMGIFGGKENNADVDATHRASSMAARRFGTPLRSNVDKSKKSTQTSTKKKVKVRRTPQRAPGSNPNTTAREKPEPHRLSLFSSVVARNTSEKTIILTPGPVGLQLEPVNEAPMYGCRVARFVDGGPNDPGQARKSGKIKPGDLVLKVEAEGMLIAATTYDEIINLLTMTHVKRIITVQSVWDSSPSARKKAKSHQRFIPTKRTSLKKGKNGKNETAIQSPSASPRLQENDKMSLNATVKSAGKRRSPCQLLSPSPSTQQESPSQKTPIRNRKIFAEESKGPVIVPIQSSTPDRASEPSNSSYLSQDTTRSSLKSISTPPRQALADQFLLFDGFMGTYEQEFSQTSNDMTSSFVDNSRVVNDSGQTSPLDSRHIRTPEVEKQPQGEISSKDDGCEEFPAELQVKQQQDLFEESLARAAYEQRLQEVRKEQSKTERELKDLYVHTCERNENKIRELQVVNEDLRKALEESKTKQNALTHTRIEELERKVAETEKLRMQTQVQANEKIHTKTNEYRRVAKAKEDSLRKRLTKLEEENYVLREESESRLIELGMARTMVTEMEFRIVEAEREKVEITNRLEDASCSIQELEESILLSKESDLNNHGIIEHTQKKLEEVTREKEALMEEIENYESFKEESSVLTEKLANSLQEKQKAVIESQSLASKIEAENYELSKQIADANSDVEQLLEEKLLLEDKLAKTWKDIEQTKNDASTIHETLMEKLENGEYYTFADIEEKKIVIQSLTKDLQVLKETSKDELIKSSKKAINLHLQLRGAKRELLEIQQSEIEVTEERNDLQERKLELEEIIADMDSRVKKATKMYEDEQAVVNELKIQIETVTKSKEIAEVKHRELIEALSLQIASKTSELSSCREKLDEMDLLTKDVVATSENLKTQVESVTKSKEEAELQYQESIESLSLQLESKKSELTMCQGRVKEIQYLKDEQSKMNANLQSQLDDMTKAEKESELKFQDSIKLLSSKLESNRNELLLCEGLMKEAESHKEKQLMIISNLQSQLDAVTKSKDESESKYEESMVSLSTELESRKTELLLCQSRLEQTLSQKDEQAKMITDLQSQLDDMKKLKEESELQQKKSIESLSSELNSRKGELLSCENSIKEFKSKNDEQSKMITDLQSQLDDVKTSNEESELQHKKSIESLSSELEVKKVRLSSCERLLDESEAKEDEQSKMITDLQSQLDDIKTSKEESELQHEESIESLSSKLELVKGELLSCKDELESIRASKEDAIAAGVLLRHDMNALVTSKKQLEIQHNESVEAIVSELESKNNELSQGLTKLKTTESQLEHKVDALQIEKEELVAECEGKVGLLAARLENEEKKLISAEKRERELLEKLKLLSIERENELKRSDLRIEDLTAGLQYEYEEFSSMEMRLDILQEEYDSVKSSLDTAMEEANSLRMEKKEIVNIHEEEMKRLNSELRSQHTLFETAESNLKQSIEKSVQYKKDIEQLTNELHTTRSEFSVVQEKLNFFEDNGIDSTTLAELKKSIDSLKSENEEASTQYWESIQELTTDLQSRNQELSSKQSAIDHMEEEIQCNEIKIQELELEIFQKDIAIGNLRAELTVQAKRLDCSDTENSKKLDIISSLKSKIIDIETSADDRQSSCDALKKNVRDLEKAKEKISIDSCSEIFRLVKRLAILDHTHSDVKDQRLKAMEIAVMQRKWQKQATLNVESLQKKLAAMSKRAIQFENELKVNVSEQQEGKNRFTIELSEKTKQLERQSIMITEMQAEISAMQLVAKNFEDSKEKEISALITENENLQSMLSSEKIANAQIVGEAYDVRIELELLDEKFNSVVSTKEKSMRTCTAFARSLFQANAIITSLSVQLKNNNRMLTEAFLNSQKYKLEKEEKLEALEESRSLSQELEKNTEELKSHLAKTEECVKKTQQSLGDAQQSESDLRTQFNEWKNCLQNTVREIQANIRNAPAKAANEEIGDNGLNRNEHYEGSAVDLPSIIGEINRLIDSNLSLERDLEAMKNDKLITSELLEKSMRTVRVLHEDASELREKVEAKNRDIDFLTEELKSAESSSLRLKKDLEWNEKDYQSHVVELQQQVLSTRAIFIADHFKMQNLERCVSNLHQSENAKANEILELQATNGKLHDKMERMALIVAEREHQCEELLRAMKMKEMTPLTDEGKGEEETTKKSERTEKARLLKNIEDLSVKLISIEESHRQSEIMHKSTEESLKKNVSKLRAEFVAKHLETNDLKKQIVLLNHSKKKAKESITEFKRIISNLRADLDKSEVALSRSQTHASEVDEQMIFIMNERKQCQEKLESLLKNKDEELNMLGDKVIQTNAAIESMEIENASLKRDNTKNQKKLEDSLSQKSFEVEQLQERTLFLENSLKNSEKKINEKESARKSEARKYSNLQREMDCLSTKLETLEKEKYALSETISIQQKQLHVKEEKFNLEIANELTRLREKVSILEVESSTKSKSLADIGSALESMRIRFGNLTDEKNELDEKFGSTNVELRQCRELLEDKEKHLIASNAMREAIGRDFENLIHQLGEEKNTRLKEVGVLKNKNANLEATNLTLCESVEDARKKTAALEKELQHVNDHCVRSDPPVIEGAKSDHVSSVKDAFFKQAAVLEDVKISEKMLEDLIKEVMNLASKSESELLELSSTLGTVDDLFLNPSNLLASLDLAGMDSSENYFAEVRSRLEDLAALAYTTSVELNDRQNRLMQWKAKRSESPSLPKTHVESTCDVTAVVTDAAKEVRDKVAGARLLCCVLENNNKMEVASAFRKWTCAAGIMTASSNAKETAAELAHELHVTREKIMVLKRHMKGTRAGKQKPKLRRILERIDTNARHHDDHIKMHSSNTIDIHTDGNDCSFGI